MINRYYLCLPVCIMSTPAWGQKTCDVTCQEALDYEHDQVIRGTRPKEPNFPPIAAISITDIVITIVGKLNDSSSEKTESISYPLTQSGNRLENSLRTVAGFAQFRRSDARSANPTSQGATLRGLGGNASSRALLTLDGVPQADPFGGWVSWPSYDALTLGSVRVRRGGGQPSVGPGAIAGVIELDSLQYSNGYKASAAYGSRDSLDAKVSGLYDLGKGSVSASASYARGDGFIPIVKRQRGSADRAAPYQQAGIAIRAVAPLTGNTELQSSLRAYFDNRERGFAFSDNQNSGVDASLRLVNRRSDWQWSALGYVQIREFANRFGAVSADRSSVTLTLDQYAVPSTGLGARIELRPPLGDKGELRVGGDWRRVMGETRENFFFTGTVPGRNRNAGGRNDIFGSFAELTLQPTDALTITAGGRLDGWRIADGFRKEINLPSGSTRSDDRFADRRGREWTGRTGIAFKASDTINLRVATYTGWRLPTLNELYRPFRVGADATASNEALAPERVKGAEIGAEYVRDSFRFSATVFANRLNGAIANVGGGQGPAVFPGVGFVAAGGTYRQRQNLDAINSKGVEIDAAYTAKNLTVSFGYAYNDARVVASRNALQLNNLRPAQVPRHFANADLLYDSGPVRFDANLRYIGAQFEDDGNIRPLKFATITDVGAQFELKKALSLELRVENLLDTEVQSAISDSGVIESATPRTIWLGLKMKIQ